MTQSLRRYLLRRKTGETMDFNEKIEISSIPAVSAIYFALLQCGYDYYSFERSAEHTNAIKMFRETDTALEFFSEIKQNTCAVYPYWPRAAMLESATFYIHPDMNDFTDIERYRDFIMSAGNITDDERGLSFWEWIVLFPRELKKVLLSDSFKNYMKWENQWIQQQNILHKNQLEFLKSCIDFCVKYYYSPIKRVQLVLSPIKCVYSSDYHIIGDCFLFSSGAFKIDFVIHEFLHHVVHPTVTKCKSYILAGKQKYKDIDASYYLTGDESGRLNAFEEFAVRSLTKKFQEGIFPTDLEMYIKAL